jgi:hypothetical protein
MGCRTAVYQVAQWQREFRPIDLLERLRDRTFSHSWTVSDQTLQQIHQQMLTWASEQYGDLDQTMLFEGAFTLWVSRFPRIRTDPDLTWRGRYQTCKDRRIGVA